MKIAIVYSTFYIAGGAENIIIWLSAELLQRGHEVTIFTSEYDKKNLNIPSDVRERIVEIYAGGNYSTWLDWILAGWRLRKHLQAFDIVNPHNFPANVWVYYAKRFSQSFPPIVWYCHEAARTLYEPDTHIQRGRYHSVKTFMYLKLKQEGFGILTKILQKGIFYGMTRLFRQRLLTRHIHLDCQAVRSCSRILANSRYTAAKIQDLYQCLVETCYQGIPECSLPPLPQAHKQDYFLTVSRLEPLKHVDAIIRACGILKNRRQQNDITLVIVGQGTQERALKELVGQLGLNQQVSFTGYVSDEELHSYYSDALACVFVPEDEPFGLVPLEAMLHHTAVIVSHQGGPVETVMHNVTGLHVNPHHPEQIADAMERLLNNKADAIEMGLNGSRHVLEHFTFPRFVDRFEATLRSLVTIDGE